MQQRRGLSRKWFTGDPGEWETTQKDGVLLGFNRSAHKLKPTLILWRKDRSVWAGPWNKKPPWLEGKVGATAAPRCAGSIHQPQV